MRSVIAAPLLLLMACDAGLPTVAVTPSIEAGTYLYVEGSNSRQVVQYWVVASGPDAALGYEIRGADQVLLASGSFSSTGELTRQSSVRTTDGWTTTTQVTLRRNSNGYECANVVTTYIPNNWFTGGPTSNSQAIECTFRYLHR